MQTFTVKIYSTFLFALLSQLALAQFHDDFSDNDFINSPAWSGSDSLFTVLDHRLMLNGKNEDGVAYLSTSSNIAKPASWEFTFSFHFNPSSANYAMVYLIADQPDLTLPLIGYFVMIGNNTDEVSLYKQTGTTFSEIIDGRDGLLNLSMVGARIKVTRDDTGWKLFTDVAGGGYDPEGSSDDDTYTESKYFGVLCRYTATRSDKFFFDDFTVDGNVAKDEIPPALSVITVSSATELKLTFSEPLDPESAIRLDHYAIDDTRRPTEAILADDGRTVFLVFDEPFSESTHLILVTGVRDLSGNTIDSISRDFIYVKPIRGAGKDVILTEIFADPSPTVGLPESEFVEIYNRSDKTFDLSGWTISDGSSTAIFPEFILLPKVYLVLTSEATNADDFDGALFLKGFPTLNNSNDVLVLKDQNGKTIDSVGYSQSWYKDTDKEDGGWTLELIDPGNICSGHENWAASEDVRGGTPGIQNSILANKPDTRGPKLLSAIPVSPTTIHLKFDERLEKPLSPDLKVVIDPPIPPGNIRFGNNALTELELSLAQEIKKGITYSIIITNLKDCAGNVIQETNRKAMFGMPEEADSLDVILNEILFNPRPTGVDFVEIFNNSPKFINLKGWTIGNPEGIRVPLTETDLILPPGSYLAITPDPQTLKGQYILGVEENFFQLKNLPSLNDDGGTVALIDNKGKIIDLLHFSKDMHSVFIKNEEGVSLERISNSASSTTQNWKSASSSVGFATPGYMNSNAVDNSAGTDPLLVVPEIFNPMAGQANFALIHYNFDRGGYVANLKIFDPQGRIVKQLANNDPLGTNGFYRWDGDRDDGSKARVGYYMIWLEVFDEQGTVKRYLERVAIASSFE